MSDIWQPPNIYFYPIQIGRKNCTEDGKTKKDLEAELEPLCAEIRRLEGEAEKIKKELYTFKPFINDPPLTDIHMDLLLKAGYTKVHRDDEAYDTFRKTVSGIIQYNDLKQTLRHTPTHYEDVLMKKGKCHILIIKQVQIGPTGAYHLAASWSTDKKPFVVDFEEIRKEAIQMITRALSIRCSAGVIMSVVSIPMLVATENFPLYQGYIIGILLSMAIYMTTTGPALLKEKKRINALKL